MCFGSQIISVKVVLIGILLISCEFECKKLEQVLIISRHNVRTPLSKNLAEMTSKSWPHWKEKSGYLTPKGALLEGYMGEFFYAWLNENGLLPIGCPTEEVFYVYANVKQRTKASAKAFVSKAFPDCNITVHYNSNLTDPVFNPVIHNTTSAFRDIAIDEMQTRLKSLQLNASYEDIEQILDYKNSELCKNEKKCNLMTDKNKIINVVPGEKPNVSGPLKIGNSVIDAFIMEYYEGLPLQNVAWGKLTDNKQWTTIMDLSRGYHNVIFNTTLIAKDISEPMLKYMLKIFLNKNSSTVTLLVGHDANMYTIINGLNFKPYILKNQYEITPVGGKIVFQKWFDDKNAVPLLKIDYVYQSTLQMRSGMKLSMANPPEFVTLELEGCKIDDNGFCLWKDFIRLLETL